MNAIVAGGAGFIGSALVKHLVKDGISVKVIDNLWRGNLKNLKLSDDEAVIDLNKDFYLADLTDYSKCLELIREADVVYHLADVVGGIHFVFNNEEFVFRQNVLIDSNVISACLLNNIPNYIYVGTACSFPKHLQMQEGIVALSEEQTYPAEPESSYGWSKLMGEYFAGLHQRSGKINIGLLRFHNVYGPGQSYDPEDSQVIPSLIYKVINLKDGLLNVWGSGNQYRDFVFIDDVVESLALVLEHGMNKGLIQIGSEKATTIKELAELIVGISKKRITVRYDASRPEGDRGRIAVCDRARKILGWKPETGLETGLERTYNWISERINVKR